MVGRVSKRLVAQGGQSPACCSPLRIRDIGRREEREVSVAGWRCNLIGIGHARAAGARPRASCMASCRGMRASRFSAVLSVRY
jgi:hypothetical protein